MHELIFIRPKNKSEEIWTGIRPSCKEATTITGIQAVYTTNDFREFGIDFSKMEEVWVEYTLQPNSEAFSKIALANLVEDFQRKLPANLSVEESKPYKVLASMREVN